VKRRIFISYRRSDSQDITGRLCDRLVSSFGQRSVFKDVDAIPAGVDFRKHLEDEVDHCDLLLAVIGENWLTVTNAAGQRRLDDESDFVRIEIEAAMKRGIPVLPVLVGQTAMPDDTQLPLTLAPFAYRQAVRVRPDPDFHRDMDRLDSAIKMALEPPTGIPLRGVLRGPKNRKLWIAAVLGLLMLAVAALYLLARQSYRPSPETADWFAQGLAAFRAGTYEKARRILERTVSADGRYAPAYAFLAASYNELDSTENAKTAMIRAMQLGQDYRWSEIDAHRVQAVQYVIGREFDRAVPEFSRLVDAADSREKAGSLLDLAWAAQKAGDNDAAERTVRRVLAANAQDPDGQLRLAEIYLRQHKSDLANASFEKAETLFQLGGNYDGVEEALLQHSISLGRIDKPLDAISLIQRGARMAELTGGQYYNIRLQLALALAYRNAGSIQDSQTAAQQALDIAVANRMDSTAAIGLIDLGTAYFLRGEPAPAEAYYLRGLSAAQRGRSGFSEARAELSLASLCLEYDRPLETVKWAESSAGFFHKAGFRREEMQNLIVLGGAKNTLAQFDEAETILRGALRLAEELGDKEQNGVVHAYLAEGLANSGRLPEAVAEQTRALALYGEMRGGYRAAFGYSLRARILARMGRFQQAADDLSSAEVRIRKLEGSQAQLKSRAKLARAEIAYYQGHWTEAAARAREATALNGGEGENAEALMWAGLALIRQGSVQKGLTMCQSAIKADSDKFRNYNSGQERQFLAEALESAGLHTESQRYAQEALQFFTDHRSPEGAWRSAAILSVAFRPRDRVIQDAFKSLKTSWTDDELQTYLQRTDLKPVFQVSAKLR
jgi:tetratricopeptide (TPR) repeat protein